MSNTELWNKVCKSDPSHVKTATRGLKAVCAQSQVKRATELWGPYGQRWGLADLKYEVIQVADVPTMTLDAVFYYPGADGERVSFPISDDMAFKPNNDTRKKLRTSCQSKALGLLGFNSDVYEGLYDDNKYVDAVKAESDLRKKIRDSFTGKLSVQDIERRWLRVLELNDDGMLTDADVQEFGELKDAAIKRASAKEQRLLTAMLRDKCGCKSHEDQRDAIEWLTGIGPDDSIDDPHVVSEALSRLRDYEAGGNNCEELLSKARGN